MTLQDVGGGSQRFVPPAVNYVPDMMALTRPAQIDPSVRALGQARYMVHDMTWSRQWPNELGARFQGAFYWRVELYDARGGLRQDGRVDEDHARASLTDLVCDDQGILRLPFLIVTTTLANPPAGPSRAMRANFLGREIFGFLEPGVLQRLRAETSTTNPIPSTVAGFTAPAAGSNELNCMAQITVNAVPYLAIGYLGNGGAAATFQVLSDLANPPTSSTLPGETGQIDGIVQTPIDNDAVLYMSNGAIRAFGTNVGVGAVTIEIRQTGFPIGGYCAGTLALGGGAAQVLWVVPTNGVPMRFANDLTAAASSRDFVGKAVLTDLRGWNPTELKFPLKYVSFATVVDGDKVFACDLESHYLHTGRSIIAVDKAGDWPANSDKMRMCRGHHVKGDKIFWLVNEVARTGSAVPTRMWWMEYDVQLNTSRQVSRAVTTSTLGIYNAGGAALPASLSNDVLTTFGGAGVDNLWYQQYQPPANVLGYALRKTTGATAGTGQMYEASGTMSWGPQEIPGLEGADKIVARITGPAQESLLTGGAGTRLIVTAGGKTATFDTQVPSQTHPYTDFENNSNWFQRLTVDLTASRSTTATDFLRLTGNYFPIVIEGFAVKRGLRLPPNWRGPQR